MLKVWIGKIVLNKKGFKFQRAYPGKCDTWETFKTIKNNRIES